MWLRLILGDWHPLLRDPIDVLRYALLVGAALLIILDKNVEAAPLATVPVQPTTAVRGVDGLA